MVENTISFIGDISLNNKYNNLYNLGKEPFNDINNVLFSSDIVVGNLECISRGVNGENLYKKPRLKTNIETFNMNLKQRLESFETT